jgi:hypothetical protein
MRVPRILPGRLHLLAYAACFFCFAHRALCASAILLRPAADMVRFAFTDADLLLLLDPGGRPRLGGWAVEARRSRARVSLAISSSMERSRDLISIPANISGERP